MDPFRNNDNHHNRRDSRRQKSTGNISRDGRRKSTTYSINAPTSIPSWVRNIVNEKTGTEGHCVQFVLSKNLTSTDIDRNQNRFLLPLLPAEKNILPFLTEEEKQLAGYVPQNANDNNGTKKGVNVKVYDKGGAEFSDVALAYWKSNEAWVINGRDYKFMRSMWRPHIKVEVWFFRTPTAVARRPAEPEISLELTLGRAEQAAPVRDERVNPDQEHRSPTTLNFIIGRSDDGVDQQ